MSAYPIVLKDQPQKDDVLHRFELIEGNIEGDGFEPISIWLKLPGAKTPTNVCVECGAILEMPDGSLEAHLKKYQAEHGGVDSIVRIAYRHKGPIPSTRPPGMTVVTDDNRSKIISPRDFANMQEASNQDS